MATNGRRRRIAVLGGGLGGLSAAYDIATHDKNCEITVYQMGWRLGGKIASSRNCANGMRIEEHGIHVLFGAYENLFYLLRRVYHSLGKRWQDAFMEHNDFTLMEQVGDRWVPWHLGLPRAPGDPGDCLASGADWRIETPRLVTDLIGWLRDRVTDYFAGTPLERPARWFFDFSLGRAHETARHIHALADNTEAAKPYRTRLLRHLQLNLLLLRIIGWIGHLLWHAWHALRSVLGPALEQVDNVRRLWIAAELGVACAAGLTRAAINSETREQLDQHDLREWLSGNAGFGTRISPTTASSAPLRMIYEVVFAYRSGDPNQPALAAGTGVRDLLRLLLDRRGALAYTMYAGSAETMVTPLYEALREENVRFEFFHRVDRLELSADGRRIERIHCTQQAQPTAGYDPLLPNGGWPDRPKYDLLKDGQRLRDRELEDGGRTLEMPDFNPPMSTPRVLECGAPGDQGFDEVVLAIPIEALRTICKPLAERDPRWRDMLSQLKTTPTQSVQLWFSGTAADLGWQGVSTAPTLLGGYAQTLGNWVDLSLTLKQEDWQARGFPEPGSVAYLCGPLAEAGAPRGGVDSIRTHVQETCRRWLADHGSRLWPAAFRDGAFDPSVLIARPDSAPANRYAAQFFRANTHPAERYTLTLPGTTGYRLAPGDSGFTNLVLAGDWTLNGFDVGSVEATAMSGRLAARAVLGCGADVLPVYGAAA